ncbi:MFS transporter [Myxococcota bacterium]|nr:MFS transporter [Myxococcota bacterium]
MLTSTPAAADPPILLDMNRAQWIVLLAAWLGWGFDCFDALLFNFVAPNCIPTLLGIPIGSKEAADVVPYWNGVFSSLLLIGWATGGILFGKVADRLGRTRTLMLTMAMYSLGTAACAFAPNLAVLAVFRLIASLGIGGEWAAGAAMVAEVVPERRRVEAGALLYTAAPLGLIGATFVDHAIAGVAFVDQPEMSWRYVFLCGLIPTAVALGVRWFVKEPERWQSVATAAAPPTIAELFTPQWRARTLSGLALAIVALITWWSCNAFLPTLATGLARAEATARGLDASATGGLIGNWKSIALNSFNIGGLIGTMLTVPIAKRLGRRVMFGLYFLLSGIAILAVFGLDLAPISRLWGSFFVGLTIFGVFGSFTYYLPELYPTRLRATGAGFCYNAGRVLAAAGPFWVGSVAKGGPDAVVDALFAIGFVPLVGLFVLPMVIETKDQPLND